MKKLFKYFGLILSVTLMGAFTACNPQEAEENAEVGLAIKVFSPTKVVAGSAMTINGSGFTDATEIIFPGEVSVTSFKIVTDNMIRVSAPNGIAGEGGKIVVRTATEEAVSSVDLTLGNPTITGYSAQPGETITGGNQLTIYGTDLEFITSVELRDEDGNPVVIKDNAFYRKGTSNVVIIVPKNIYEGTFAGKVSSLDGQTFTMPEYEYKKPVAGHWELQKVYFWQNPDPASSEPVSWNGIYRFGKEGTDGNNECIATIAPDDWEKMKTGTFYMDANIVNPDWYNVRITNGWWNPNWKGGDIGKGNEQIVDNGDGTFTLTVDVTDDPDFVASLDERHFLFTGEGYTPLGLYVIEEVWVGDGAPPVLEYDIAAFTVYEAEDVRDTNIEWPFYPSWSDKSGKARIMRGMGDPTIESLALTTDSKFVVYKEVGTTGQIQWNNPNWGAFADVSCNDWDGGAETIEVPLTEDMLKCISGEISDGWGNTAIIIQGDGLKVNKIVLVP